MAEKGREIAQFMHRLRLLLKRILVAIPFVSGAASAPTHSQPGIKTKPIDRVAELRQRLLDMDRRASVSQEPSNAHAQGDKQGNSRDAEQHAQGSNWPNYWADWPNWGNWGNWSNY
jgi:Ni/Co efflux regulator RcnB